MSKKFERKTVRLSDGQMVSMKKLTCNQCKKVFWNFWSAPTQPYCSSLCEQVAGDNPEKRRKLWGNKNYGPK